MLPKTVKTQEIWLPSELKTGKFYNWQMPSTEVKPTLSTNVSDSGSRVTQNSNQGDLGIISGRQERER